MAFNWLIKLDTYANATYGRSISRAIASGTCVRCGERAHPIMDVEAAAAYTRVGLCDRCHRARKASGGTVLPFDPNRKRRQE